MIDFDNVIVGVGYDRKIFLWFCDAMKKRKERRPKEPKGKAENGSYCPKKKLGQSWAYTKDKVEKEDDRKDVT